MLEKKKLKELVSTIIQLLVDADYPELELRSKGIRLNAHDLDRAISEYGCHLVLPPANAYELMDVVKVKGCDKWSVTMPLWSREEGRSDLSIELTVVECSDNLVFEIDDLHVL